MSSDRTLEGKRALILGAGARGNMGQVMARRFVEEGAQVVVAGRNIAELDRLANEIGGRACQCDITLEEDVRARAHFAREAMGGLDVAVNSTGWGLMRGFLETSVADMDAMSAVQFRGPFLFIQEM